MIAEKISLIANIKESEIDKVHIFIEIAKDIIKKYLNNDEITLEYIEANFENAVILLVINAINSDRQGNIKQMTQGSKSITYGTDKGFKITEDIKSLLPAPYIKLYY